MEAPELMKNICLKIKGSKHLDTRTQKIVLHLLKLEYDKWLLEFEEDFGYVPSEIDDKNFEYLKNTIFGGKI